MRARVLCVLILVGVVPLSGCHHKPDSLEKCLRERIRATTRMTEILEDVTDGSSAEESRPQLEALLGQLEDISKREIKLRDNNISPAAAMRLAEMERELTESLNRLQKARAEAMKNAAVAEILKDLPFPDPPKDIRQDWTGRESRTVVLTHFS